MFQRSLESSQTMLFKFQPKMSVLTQEWTAVDPGFWAPVAAAPAKAPAVKK